MSDGYVLMKRYASDKERGSAFAVPELMDPAVGGAFQSLLDPSQAKTAYRWLTGDPVPDYAELDAGRQLRALEMVSALHRSAGVPLLVLIDGLGILAQVGPEAMWSMLKQMIESFTAGAAWLVIAGLDEAWTAVPADVEARLQRPGVLQLADLSTQETKALLEIYAGGDTGLRYETIDAIREHSARKPRGILAIAHELFEIHSGALQAATPQEAKQAATHSKAQIRSVKSGTERVGAPEHVAAHPDNPALVDELGRRPFAEVIGARIEEVRGRDTDVPQEGSAFMVNIHGPWGAGKTSVLNFLRAYLQDTGRPPERRWIVVEFNAWRSKRQQPPWWAFIKEIHAQAVHQLDWRDSIRLRMVGSGGA